MSWPDFDEQLQNSSAMVTANRITARAPFQPIQIDSFVCVFTLFGCLVNILFETNTLLVAQALVIIGTLIEVISSCTFSRLCNG